MNFDFPCPWALQCSRTESVNLQLEFQFVWFVPSMSSSSVNFSHSVSTIGHLVPDCDLGKRPPVDLQFRWSPSHSLPRGAISFNLSLPSLTAAIELNSPRSVSSQFGTSGYHIPPAMNRNFVRWVSDPLDANSIRGASTSFAFHSTCGWYRPRAPRHEL